MATAFPYTQLLADIFYLSNFTFPFLSTSTSLCHTSYTCHFSKQTRFTTSHILATTNYSLHSSTTYASAIFFFSFFFLRKDGVLRPFFFFLSFLGDSSVDMSFVGEPYHNETQPSNFTCFSNSNCMHYPLQF